MMIVYFMYLYMDFSHCCFGCVVAKLEKTKYCSVELTEDKYNHFVYAVKNHYWYQMYIDDLPIWGIVGEIDEKEKSTTYSIWTHKKFSIGVNGQQIVDVNLTSEGKQQLTPGMVLDFTYEASVTTYHSFLKYTLSVIATSNIDKLTQQQKKVTTDNIHPHVI